MFKYCLGINPVESGAGFKKLTLRPFVDFSGKLNYAKGSYDSKMGKIFAEWKVENGKATYIAKVPKEIDLTVDAPDNVEVTVERY